MKLTYTIRISLTCAVLLLLQLGATAQTKAPVAEQETTVLKASGSKTGLSLGLSAAESADHTTLLQLLKASDLLKKANDKGPYTVFAPTNAAFTQLPDGELSDLLLPSSKQRLIQFLAYHVVKGRITSDQLKDGQSLTNLAGQILIVHKQGSDITIKDGRGTVAEVLQADVRATNGVVYSVNRVLQRVVNKGPIVR
ncbi:fasciclin domain-containing protein [Spirosoma agri]|uniref:Fasciclin domain-containing protein n=1 Tax=Spirosoma agri TaxID=1987381 RepID=A0A6M0IRG5_9BACT|nr:fasciclin domain-containing protein [Spirosoma agri]NEU70674.1 fasciclin domain-containing protein [Spirosoma agri]